MLYYLDVESNSLDTDIGDIVTIQYQPIDLKGESTGGLIILKSWESSEQDIVEKFYKIFVTNCVWDFVPVGSNLIFDMTFLLKKFKKYNLPINENMIDFIFSKPIIDTKSIQVITNNMQFRGHSLDLMTTKIGKGSDIPVWFKDKEYDKIVEYIEQETKAFLKAFQIIIEHCKDLKEKLK